MTRIARGAGSITMRRLHVSFPSLVKDCGVVSLLLASAARLLGDDMPAGAEVAAVPVKATQPGAALPAISPGLPAVSPGLPHAAPAPAVDPSGTPLDFPRGDGVPAPASAVDPAASGGDTRYLGGLSPGNRPDLRRIDPPLFIEDDPADQFPWVQALELERPDSYAAETPEASPFDVSPWFLFHQKLDKRRSLSNRVFHFDAPLFYVPPPRETEISKKVRKVVMSKIYRELRSKVRSEWRSQFREHPSLTYAEYERRLIQINNIGKDPNDVDEFNVDYTLNEVKQDFFRKEYADGERDIPLLTWGPFTVTDGGAMKFDLGTATHAEPHDAEIELGSERRKPLIGTDHYRLDTSLILNVNPFRAYTAGDAMYMVRRYGVNVEVGMLSDVLKREMIAAEFEFEGDLQGDFAVFANFVIKSR